MHYAASSSRTTYVLYTYTELRSTLYYHKYKVVRNLFARIHDSYAYAPLARWIFFIYYVAAHGTHP